MTAIISATIEEFEHGAWVADLESTAAFDGSFSIGTDKWAGTKVSERLDFQRYHTRVIGGASKLGVILGDKYYSGNVSLQKALEDICREGGEKTGTAPPSLFLNTWQRLKGTVAQSLDQLADLFDMIWWIDRTGALSIANVRPVGAKAKGIRVLSDVDSSVILVEPASVTLGSSYRSDDGSVVMDKIRHVRWNFTAERTSAQLYPVPFLFRSPVQTAYDVFYDARVDRDNGDGTIDVIADARFGVTKVKLFCGIPGSKVQVRGGEEVTLGFLGGDPQKPFAVSMAQNTAATKQVARNGDTVKVTLSAAEVTGLTLTAGGSPVIATTPANTVDVTGTITSGSDRLKVGD